MSAAPKRRCACGALCRPAGKSCRKCHAKHNRTYRARQRRLANRIMADNLELRAEVKRLQRVGVKLSDQVADLQCRLLKRDTGREHAVFEVLVEYGDGSKRWTPSAPMPKNEAESMVVEHRALGRQARIREITVEIEA